MALGLRTLLLCCCALTATSQKPLCRQAFAANVPWRDCRVTIGGLANQGPEVFQRTMAPTFEGYLTEALNATLGLEFEALPLAFGQDAELSRTGMVDYVFTNAGAYSCLMAEFQVTSVASLVNYRRGHALDKFAGVIISRADSNFTRVEDLRRARVAAVSISGLGAMQLQQAALLSLGVNVMTDAQQIIFTGNQNKIVQEVQDGWADVGFVRTDMVDRVAARGDTKWEYFQVINEIADTSFPFRRSTELTPEWPFGALPHVPADISKEVGLALMRLDRFSPEPHLSEPAINGSFVTFAPPKNYLDVLATLGSVGYYSDNERRCLQADNVLSFVKCPDGWVKQRPDVAFCPPEHCRSEYTCLCRPCVKLKDPELVVTVEALPTSWNPNINGTAVAAQSSFATSCSRMSRCAYVAAGQNVLWRLLDQIGDAVREEINQYRLQTVEVLTELHGSWRPLRRESVILDGVQTQQYVLNTTTMAVGVHIVQLRINGEQAAISPVVVEVFEPVPQKVDCPAGHGMEINGTCSPCPAGTSGGELVNMDTGIPTPTCVPCSRGRFQSLAGESACRRCGVGYISDQQGSASCSECPPGSSTLGETGATVCTACLPGQQQTVTEDGLKVCQDCPAGGFAAAVGSTECVHCPPGSFSQSTGAARCLPCQPGYIAAHGGSAQCDKCPRGSYAEASSNLTQCVPCGLGMTTEELGSDSPSLCRCPVGSFLLPQKGCERCESRKEWQGLECPGGNEPPLQVAGYWVHVLDSSTRDYSVYRCRDTLECPAGHLGICAAGRQGQACNDCRDGFAGSDFGECARCEGTSVLPLLGASFATLVMLVCLVLVVDMDRSKRSLSQLTVLMVGGQLLMAMQALIAVRQLPIDWVDPVKSILDVLSLFSFDMDLLQVSCIFQRDNPLVKFGLQLLAYPCFVAMLGIISLFFRVFKRNISFDSMFNLNGILLFMLFIMITLTVLTPFQCAPNPNGTTYMSTNPGVTCWESEEHVALVIMALVGTLAYPVSLLAWTTWTTLQYPRRVQNGEGLRLVHRHRFLFERFTLECYYYGLLLMLRNAAVALVPVLFVAVPVAQLVCMSFVFLLGQTVQSRLWPWRTDLANRADLGTAVCLVLVLTACAPLISVEAENERLLLSIFLFVTVLGALISGLGTIFLGVYRRLVPLQTYQAFLCHHKAGAGSLCRLLKLMLTKMTDGNTFLDSDNLEDLDTLFEIVRCNCKTLIVVMTPEVLKRVWCAGEIVTAHRNRVHIVPLRCDGFVPLNESGFKQVSSSWSREQRHMLASYGITKDHIQAAYRHLLELPYLTLSRSASPTEQEEVILELVNTCKLSKRRFQVSSSSSGRPRIVVVGAITDVEVLATCQIVEFMVQRRVHVETMTLRNAQEAETAMGAFSHVIVVLTRGILSDPAFVEIFQLLGPSRECEAVTPTCSKQPSHNRNSDAQFLMINADASFEFPDLAYYKRLARGETPPGVPSDQGPRLADAYRTIFGILACPLTPHGSQSILNQQMEEVCSRIRGLHDYVSTASTPVTNRSYDTDFAPKDTGASLASLSSIGEATTNANSPSKKWKSCPSEETQLPESSLLGTPCLTPSASRFRSELSSRAAGQVASILL